METTRRPKKSNKGKVALVVSAVVLGASVALFEPQIKNLFNRVRDSSKGRQTSTGVVSVSTDSLTKAYQDSISSQKTASGSVVPSKESSGGRQTKEYIVQPGDNLFSIVYKELGLTGMDAYGAVLRLQRINNLIPERDVYCNLNGRQVEGQDGLADLIFPGEKLRLIQ